MHVVRKRQLCSPTIERIVIAMTDEHPDIILFESLQAINESQLSRKAIFGAIKHITSDNKTVDVFLNT